METMNQVEINPSKILQVGMGFFASKTLLSAVNMQLFTKLSGKEMTGIQITDALGLHERGIYDFLDALVALGFLRRTGLKEGALYGNSEDSEIFLDRNKPSYVGGMLEMSNNRLYGFWNDLEEGLRTGLPQNELKGKETGLFEELYSDQDRLSEFLAAMGGIQMGNFMAFSNGFDFTGYTTHCDIGGAGAHLSAQVVINNPHMSGITFDLPPVAPIALKNISAMGLEDKIEIRSGDFFKDRFPKADVITMGNVLHDWGTKDKLTLIQKGYDALTEGGALVVIENIIDNDRSENVFGLLMSLNMLIETSEGFDFSAADFDGWAREVGFKRTEVMPLTGPSSAVIAYK